MGNEDTDEKKNKVGRGGLFGTGFLALRSKQKRYQDYLDAMKEGNANYKAGYYSKAVAAMDAEKAQRGELGLSDAEKAQQREEGQRQAGNLIEAQSGQLGQLGLTGDTSQMSKAIRSSNQQLAEAGAVGSAEANQLSSALAMQQGASLQARSERQQERDRQDIQYWTEFILDSSNPNYALPGMIGGEMEQGASGAGATEAAAGYEAAAGAEAAPAAGAAVAAI